MARELAKMVKVGTAGVLLPSLIQGAEGAPLYVSWLMREKRSFLLLGHLCLIIHKREIVKSCKASTLPKIVKLMGSESLVLCF